MGSGEEQEEEKEEEAQLSNGCEFGGGGGGGGVPGGDKSVEEERGRVFLVEDSASLYAKLRCYQQTPGSQYHEPIKLVEAKMLGDLFTLVELEHSSPAVPPPATSQTRKVDETVGGNGVKLSVTVAKEEDTASGSSPDDAVWPRLQEAASTRDVCESPPCGT